MTTNFASFILALGSTFMIYALLSIALNLQWGQAGIMNFGVAGFFMLGAYITGISMVSPTSIAWVHVGLSLPFPVALLLAISVTGIIAWLISPLVRLGVEQLAIITLAFAELIAVIVENNTSLTGGGRGIYITSTLDKNLGLLSYNLAFFLILLITVLLIYYFLRKLNFSQFGRILNAARQNEMKAKALGFDTVSYRRKVFVIGSMIMALAGSFYIYFLLRAIPGLFSVSITFTIWIALILGGSGNNLGALLGVGIYIAIDTLCDLYLKIPGHPEIAANLTYVIMGLIFIIVIIRRPQGILGPKRSRYE
jgi:branched-chain amino acid transport system permease protein